MQTEVSTASLWKAEKPLWQWLTLLMSVGADQLNFYNAVDFG